MKKGLSWEGNSGRGFKWPWGRIARVRCRRQLRLFAILDRYPSDLETSRRANEPSFTRRSTLRYRQRDRSARYRS